MKWFFALNEEAFEAEAYAELVRVAVHTALTRTSLVPHCLYDGADSALTEWLRSRRVRILRSRTFLYDRLASIARARNDHNVVAIGAGAFLRVEIPRAAAQAGIDDEFALYTDVDVMFMREVCDSLARVRPRYFAAAPESNRDDHANMNSGVMLMNLRALRTVDADFRRFIDAHLDELVDQHWDQGAYRRYFGRSRVVRLLRGTKWGRLAPEFNWKPYWGASPNAKIVHFHGAKPHHRAAGRSEVWRAPFMRAAYLTCCEEWDGLLEDAGIS
jgi:SpoU rRNA methylase family enzyme